MEGGGSVSHGVVATLDVDERAQGIAKDFFQRSPVGHKVWWGLKQAPLTYCLSAHTHTRAHAHMYAQTLSHSHMFVVILLHKILRNSS